MNDSESSYEEWRDSVAERLVDLSALDLIAGPNKEGVLKAWHVFGFSPKRVADRLNQRLSAANGKRSKTEKATKRPAKRGAKLQKAGAYAV